MVQASLKLVLEPVFEADFQPFSYGFRPGRRQHDVIAEIHHFASPRGLLAGYEKPTSGHVSTKSGMFP